MANNDDPIILVHGFMGWGPGELFQATAYWGNQTGIEAYLAGRGYRVMTAVVGPFSSNWDRACELYACIRGGRADYGKSHSQRFGHDRFGSFAYPGLYPEWGTPDRSGQPRRVHLIGHSQGGQTIRTLAHLLAEGSADECDASSRSDDDNLSALFEGGHRWVTSLTTIATPHDGTTLTQTMGAFVPAVERLVKGLASVAGVVRENPVFDFKLGHWGLQRNAEEPLLDYVRRLAGLKVWNESEDISRFDLGIGGAARLNSWVCTPLDVYCFSWSTRTTISKEGIESPRPATNPLIAAYAKDMARRWPVIGGKEVHDKGWLPNDGAVNTISMDGPKTGKRHSIVPWTGVPLRGQWNHMGVLDGVDHLAVIGHGAEWDMLPWYENIAQLLHSLAP
jgi:triacylglycerol lipase